MTSFLLAATLLLTFTLNPGLPSEDSDE